MDNNARLWVVIPIYNHPHAIAGIVEQVRSLELDCLLVDDGSDAHCARVLHALAAQQPQNVHLLRLHENQGKGGAMLAGFRHVAQLGASHVLQIDADGQHQVADIPRFLALSLQFPQHVICGIPQYDDSVPRSRLYGRYLTHAWVWINTCSLDIRDSMCGFRVYPLPPVLALIEQEPIGRRMDFDIEIIVRLHWRGVLIINQPTRVTYPSGGISHFRLWGDNARISWMHTRLFFGMLRRLPRLLRRRLQRVRTA